MTNATKMNDYARLHDEFFQISPRIFDRFPKVRPPLDYYLFDESISRMKLIYKKGGHLPRERYSEIRSLCDKDIVFVSRHDHDIYVEYICHQLDLVLMDDHLIEKEIAKIFSKGLAVRLHAFYDQPLRENFDKLVEDVCVFAEYLHRDKYRIKAMYRRMEVEHSIISHSVNVLIIGLLLYMRLNPEYKRDHLDSMALGLILHDAGMTKIPGFVLGKNGPLQRLERDSVMQHPVVGLKMMSVLKYNDDLALKCIVDHHERIDGSGYPRSVAGKHISPAGRITAVADSFAAMTSDRPHKTAMAPEVAAAVLAQDTKRYDPTVTKSLLAYLALGK